MVEIQDLWSGYDYVRRMSCGGSKLDFGDRNLEIDLWLDSSLSAHVQYFLFKDLT
jgi:hypothetical protein